MPEWVNLNNYLTRYLARTPSSCIVLAPAMRVRVPRQQEASVPPEGFPQFSC